jgi:hypothetical protein
MGRLAASLTSFRSALLADIAGLPATTGAWAVLFSDNASRRGVSGRLVFVG